MRTLLFLLMFAFTTFSAYSEVLAQKGYVAPSKGDNVQDSYNQGNRNNRGDLPRGNNEFYEPRGVSADPTFYVQFMGFQSEERYDMNIIDDLPLYLTHDEIAMTTRLSYPGDENFLVKPANENSTLRVYEYIYNENSGLFSAGEMVYETRLGESILISCNISSMYPNFIIESTNHETGVVESFSPAVSAIDNYEAAYGTNSAPFPIIENPSRRELPPIPSIRCDIFIGFAFANESYITFNTLDGVLIPDEIPDVLRNFMDERVCVVYEERTFIHQRYGTEVTEPVFVEVYVAPVG